MVEEKILDRIKKLSAKAESAAELGNVEEAATFSAKVNELLTKHNLEMAEISTEEDLGVEGEQHTDLNLNDRWKINLLTQLCKYNFCSPVYHQHAKGGRYTRTGYKTIYSKTRTVTIIGAPENVEVVKYLFTLLSEQFMKMAASEWKTNLAVVRATILDAGLSKTTQHYKKPWRMFGNVVAPNIYKSSFYVGAVRGVANKLEAQKQRAEAANCKITDLIIVHDAAINKFKEDKFGELDSMRRSTRKINSAAYGKGVKAGENASMARGMAGGDVIATKLIG